MIQDCQQKMRTSSHPARYADGNARIASRWLNKILKYCLACCPSAPQVKTKCAVASYVLALSKVAHRAQIGLSLISKCRLICLPGETKGGRRSSVGKREPAVGTASNWWSRLTDAQRNLAQIQCTVNNADFSCITFLCRKRIGTYRLEYVHDFVSMSIFLHAYMGPSRFDISGPKCMPDRHTVRMHARCLDLVSHNRNSCTHELMPAVGVRAQVAEQCRWRGWLPE